MISERFERQPETANTKDFPMTDEPEPKDAKKDAKEPRPIIHLGMTTARKSKTSESAVILHSASRKMRWKRLSTSRPQRRNPDFR
jgi:hypothetical protein